MRTAAKYTLTITAATALMSAVSATPAFAATLADKAVSICGSGYYVQRSHVLSSSETQGVTSFQLYNASTKKNCAVTLKHPTSSSFYGGETTLGAGIRAANGSWIKDEDLYAYYAGPVYLYAPGQCVQFWGKTFQGGASSGWFETYTSPLGNCG
ncbi:serine/threonine protein kinase [Streptomyces exfoliatus]|uniref:serine/threonine protein kinase n=1 Tax=Streptomyces exfoliatus TaxID=1905 RepID=UPI003C2FDF26